METPLYATAHLCARRKLKSKVCGTTCETVCLREGGVGGPGGEQNVLANELANPSSVPHFRSHSVLLSTGHQHWEPSPFLLPRV